VTRVPPLEAAALILCLFLGGCWVEPQKHDIERIVGEQGYTQVRDLKPIFFGCDQNDVFRFSFTATSPKGNVVNGQACSSYFKGWTVRWE
jgi:hypothetical protein